MACGINNTPRITQQVQQILKTLKPATPELQQLAGFIGQCYTFSDLSIKNPHTIIVETVVLLSHKKPDDFISIKWTIVRTEKPSQTVLPTSSFSNISNQNTGLRFTQLI